LTLYEKMGPPKGGNALIRKGPKKEICWNPYLGGGNKGGRRKKKKSRQPTMTGGGAGQHFGSRNSKFSETHSYTASMRKGGEGIKKR